MHLTRIIPALLNRIYTLYLKLSVAHIGEGAIIEYPVKINNPQKIYIGRNAKICAGTWLNAAINDSRDFTLRIEENAYVGRNCHINAWCSVCIGESVLIANNVHISDASHDLSDLDVPIKDKETIFVGPVHIGRGAWVGHGAVILPTTRIGKNSVVGALSLVRKNIPDNCVAAGIPARVLRRRDA